MGRTDEKELIRRRLKEIEIKNEEYWAIYGTGNGAKLLWNLASELDILDSFNYVIERDELVEENGMFYTLPIVKIEDVDEKIDGILIAAIESGKIIKDRIENILIKKQLEYIRVIDIYEENTEIEKLEYIKYVERNFLMDSSEFVPFDEDKYKPNVFDTKILTWYLPQFHQMEINNKFHGQGFTEWTNTTKMIPMFTNHYQPHIPYDVGYYDLTNIETFKRQIYLAKHYGIYGFCMHYYWFSGTRIMEKPLELFLEHKELDMPFCLSWAMDNWTTLWDGGNKEIMLEQKLEDGDEERFMNDILPYMKDSRYIKINDRPVFVIYHIDIFKKERMKNAIHIFRKCAKQEGFSDLYIMVANAFDFDEDVEEWGADALVEFPLHQVAGLMNNYRPLGYLNPYYKGIIKSADSFIKSRKYLLKHKSKKYFRSALVSWDNSARKATSGAAIITGLTPDTFKVWLKDIIEESRQIHTTEENIVFVNSWNEWAEGSHLEPDMKYGYAYLQVVKDVLEEYKGDNDKELN